LGSFTERPIEFLTGYIIEKSLSVDNIFVFVLIFSAFAVPAAYQHQVLFWGIIGALIMRAIFIGKKFAIPLMLVLISDFYKFDPFVSLGIIAVILLVSIVLSILKPSKGK
jgi:predicted tellurium resistance membrane protein TerC